VHNPVSKPSKSPHRESDAAHLVPIKTQALDNSEGRILRLGVILAMVYLVGLVFTWIFWPDFAPVFGAMTALNVVVGRAAGMSFGYAAGLEHGVVIPANMLIESIQVLIVFPLFVLSWRHLLEIRALQAFMQRIESVAEARHGRLRRYGMFGLFAFVMVPFWMTGPVVGAVMGFLIGLRPWINMGVVLVATYMAIGIWAIVLHGISGWAATFNQYAPFALVAAVVLLILLGRFLPRYLHPGKPRTSPPASRPPAP
jgi:uncharacterized membrane protein